MKDICEECYPTEKPLCVEECQDVCPMVKTVEEQWLDEEPTITIPKWKYNQLVEKENSYDTLQQEKFNQAIGFITEYKKCTEIILLKRKSTEIYKNGKQFGTYIHEFDLHCKGGEKPKYTIKCDDDFIGYGGD